MMKKDNIYKTVFIFFTLLLSCSCSDSEIRDKYNTDEKKIKLVRTYFAEILDPPAEITIVKQENSFKAASFAYPEALNILATYKSVVDKDPFLKIILENIDLDLSIFKNKTKKRILILLRHAPSSRFIELSDKITTEVENFNFDNISAIRQLESIEIPDLGPSWTKFLQQIIIGYFPNLSVIDRKRVLASLLRKTLPNSSQAEIITALVAGSGPFFQKYIQLFADNIKTNDNEQLEELKDQLATVKSELAPIDPYYLNKYVEEINNKNNLVITLGKSLGAASTGQVILATRKTTGGETIEPPIVIKFLRPGIEEIAKREAEFFRATANTISPNMADSFKIVEENIFAEMKYSEELGKLIIGYETYNEPDSIIKVVKPVANFHQEDTWLAMDLAPGKTFKQFANIRELNLNINQILSNPQLFLKAKTDAFIKGKLTELLISKFLEKAMFKKPNGFFHGDLHEGNVMMKIDEEVYSLLKDTLLERSTTNSETLSIEDVNNLTLEDINNILYTKNTNGEPLVLMTLIDFGNAYVLETQTKRNGLLNLMLSAIDPVLVPKEFIKAANELLPENIPRINPSQYDSLAAELRAEHFVPGVIEEVSARIGRSMDLLMKHDLPVPGLIIAFSRTLAMLQATSVKVDEYISKLENSTADYFDFSNIATAALIFPVAVGTFGLPNWINQILVSCIFAQLGIVQGLEYKNYDIFITQANLKGFFCTWAATIGFSAFYNGLSLAGVCD